VPQGFAYTQYRDALREAANSGNPVWARGVLYGLATLLSPLAVAEEYHARPVCNVPFVMHNAGIQIGEHSARAYLWAQQGEYGEMAVDLLEVTKSGAEGFNAGLSVSMPLESALEGRAAVAASGLAAGSRAPVGRMLSIEPEIDQIVDRGIVEEAESAGTPFKTTQRLIRGNVGERLAADALASDGHLILMYKPDILGTNQGGIDIVTLRDGVLYLIDNKALTRTGNAASVSALTTNYAKNVAAVGRDLTAMLADPARSAAERDIIRQALQALTSGKVIRAVTNANILVENAPIVGAKLARETKFLSGVTSKLANQGIQFIDVGGPKAK
jgi:Holliday junction resolvase-like predicted endonuclease